MPAVSTRISLRPSTSIGVSIASRVRARDVGDDHALEAQEGVDQRRLADVRAPDHGQAHDVLLGVGDLVVLGQQLDEAVEQVAGAQALGGGDRDRLAEPEAVEVVREHEVVGRVDLVRGDDDRQRCRGAGCRRSPASPGRMPARASTTNSATWASASAARAWSWIETASGSSSSRSTPPVSISVKLRPFQSVESSLRSRVMPGPLVHDRLAALREPVDERGLADVRIADDGDLHASISLASIASVTTWSTTSSSVSPVVSTGIGVVAAARASSGRRWSRAGRARAGLRAPRSTVRPSRAARRRARSAGSA